MEMAETTSNRLVWTADAPGVWTTTSGRVRIDQMDYGDGPELEVSTVVDGEVASTFTTSCRTLTEAQTVALQLVTGRLRWISDGDGNYESVCGRYTISRRYWQGGGEPIGWGVEIEGEHGDAHLCCYFADAKAWAQQHHDEAAAEDVEVAA